MKVKLLIICLFSCLFAKAQDVKQQINSIKQDNEYINAEATDEDKDEAFNIALSELTSEACNHFSAMFSIDEIKNIIKTIEVKRGESIRVFVYAKIGDLQKLSSEGSGTDVPKTQSDNKPSSEKQELPQHQEQQVETTEQTTPAVTPVQDNLSNATIPSRIKTVTSVFSRMNTLTEIKSLLREYKNEGKIADYNAVKSLNVDSDACIIIFRGENIVAILQQENKGDRINYRTNSSDSLKNYSGCQAIWYK